MDFTVNRAYSAISNPIHARGAFAPTPGWILRRKSAAILWILNIFCSFFIFWKGVNLFSSFLVFLGPSWLVGGQGGTKRGHRVEILGVSKFSRHSKYFDLDFPHEEKKV